MKTFLIVLLCSSVAFAQEVAKDGTVVVSSTTESRVADAPLIETPLILLPDGSPAPGRSTKVKAGETVPYDGRLLDSQEHVRREKVNARNEGELVDLKTGNVTLSTPVFILTVAGVAVAGIVAGAAVTAVAIDATKKP